MAISTNGTVIARLAGALYNTQLSNQDYKDTVVLDVNALANTLYGRDFAKSTDLVVAQTLLTNLGLSSVAGLEAWLAAQLTAGGGVAGDGAAVVHGQAGQADGVAIARRHGGREGDGSAGGSFAGAESGQGPDRGRARRCHQQPPRDRGLSGQEVDDPCCRLKVFACLMATCAPWST